MNEYSRKLMATLAAKDAEIARLRAALDPILRHADSHAFAPPLKFSRDRCREIREEVERDR